MIRLSGGLITPALCGPAALGDRAHYGQTHLRCNVLCRSDVVRAGFLVIVRKFEDHWREFTSKMYVYGGFYFDTDYKLLRRIEDDFLRNTCVLPISRNNDTNSPEFRVCNSVLGSTPNYPFWKDFVCHIFETQDVDRVDEYNIEKITGPEGLTKFYVENINRYPEIHLPRRNSFHPLITFRGLSYEKGHSSYGAHLCWGSWRTKDLARKIKTMAVRKITCF